MNYGSSGLSHSFLKYFRCGFIENKALKYLNVQRRLGIEGDEEMERLGVMWRAGLGEAEGSGWTNHQERYVCVNDKGCSGCKYRVQTHM